jgi:hypothetical protein
MIVDLTWSSQNLFLVDHPSEKSSTVGADSDDPPIGCLTNLIILKGRLMSTSRQFYELDYSSEEQVLADHLIGLEKAALDKWFKGDTSGYETLWSTRSFTYFDAAVTERVDDHKTIEKFLASVQGRLSAERYEFRSPRIQAVKDMAVLTYQLFAKTNLIDMEYNVVEVFQKENTGWRVIHSTWSFIRPIDKKFPDRNDVV